MFHPTPVALAVCLAVTRLAVAAPGDSLDPTPRRGEEVRLQAGSISGRTGEQLNADLGVQLQQGGLRLQADHLEVRLGDSRLRATGQVDLRRNGDRFSGPELEINSETQEGFFIKPRYLLGRTQGGGQASRVDFLGPDRFAILDASYSTCRVADGDEPAWVLQARQVHLDMVSNEGIASGAVLRFYGVPLLAVPVLSFPLNSERKSGWLPPEIGTSSVVGFELGVPYYWNIAPNRDATLTPTLSTRRGAGLDSEFRYLEPSWGGETRLYTLPYDRVTAQSRWAARWRHAGELSSGYTYGWEMLRVSDENYWKDGLRGADNLTPRLLPTQAVLQRTRLFSLGDSTELEQQVYARVQRWQTLQASDPNDPSARIDSPYRREPQLGVRWRASDHQLEWTLQTEVNRFANEDSSQLTGSRAHALSSLSWQFGNSGWQLVPKLSLNAATYALDQPLTDGRTEATRVIPTFSLDNRWQLEREVTWGERTLTQTLEPRLLYVHTPWREQLGLPNFDSAGLDYNATTAFAENAFSGVDRVSDSHQITGGLTTRFIDAQGGAELARLGLAQRFLLADQRITPDGVPLTSRRSDLLLLGSTSVIPHWGLDMSLQYSSAQQQVTRTITSVSYSPGPLHVLSATYRLQRDASEQVSIGWQWPLLGPGAGTRTTPAAEAVQAGETLRLAARPDAGSCSGTLYSAGRADYSMLERRISSSLIGFEYDSGCWIGRLVVSRQSTSTSASTTKLMLQLELVGLSRIGFGSNSLTVLKDNIPGYQLLRTAPAAPSPALPAVSDP
ncbi:MAG: LPS-assembly protein LptD [Leptothrix sp. (in: b-proteobacteria)]